MGGEQLTLEELTRCFQLRERLARDEEMLQSLRDAAFPGSQKLDGMPHAPGVKDKVGDLAIEIADLEAQMRYLNKEIKRTERQVSRFIHAIPDEHIRLVFRLRFLRGLTWAEVAAVIGGRNTEAAVKSTCYRYLENLQRDVTP